MNHLKFVSNKITLFVFFSGLISFLFFGCVKKFPEQKDISGNNYVLLNQDSAKVNFPSDFKGKILVITFIYTNCPDICPMTTHNMQNVQQKLAKEGITNVQFAAMSFDPIRDTPKVLKEYAEVRDMDLRNFIFLTGNKKNIDAIIHEFDFIAIPGDTTFVNKKHQVYFYTHTDKLFLVDRQGRIRNEYRGSKVNTHKLISDIKSLED
ncbi:MAG: SCO family protein [Ignavibacteriaceae bacterium]